MGGGPSVAKYGVSHTSGQKSIILALFDIVVILFDTVEILFCTVYHTSPLLRPPPLLCSMHPVVFRRAEPAVVGAALPRPIVKPVVPYFSSSHP
jgi:hypothetical protein